MSDFNKLNKGNKRNEVVGRNANFLSLQIIKNSNYLPLGVM